MTERKRAMWFYLGFGAVAGAIGMVLWQGYQRDALCWKDIPGSDRRTWVCAGEPPPPDDDPAHYDPAW